MTSHAWYEPTRVQPLDEPVPVEAPPRVEGTTRPSMWDPVVSRLRQHPGQWFIVAETNGSGYPHGLAGVASRRGVILETRERVGGPRGDRTARIYARAVLPPDDEDPG